VEAIETWERYQLLHIRCLGFTSYLGRGRMSTKVARQSHAFKMTNCHLVLASVGNDSGVRSTNHRDTRTEHS
jgi:hypothetical protein